MAGISRVLIANRGEIAVRIIHACQKMGKEYTMKKAEYIASIFLEAVKRWEMMEDWK